jgi:hypothetical protein
MSSEHAEDTFQPQLSEPQGNQGEQTRAADEYRNNTGAGAPETANSTTAAKSPGLQKSTPQSNNGSQPATVIVRGETVTDPSAKPAVTGTPANAQKTPAPKKVSEAKLKLQNRLPSLDDFDDIGVQKEQIVVRDGKPDLAFTGTLLASAAPSAATKGYWEELRVYQTSAGKHVFSKVKRTVFADERDEHAAEIFDPAPSSATAQLLRSAHDLTHSKPKTWKDAAVDFFGYEPLAKELYRKLGEQFEEHVS